MSRHIDTGERGTAYKSLRWAGAGMIAVLLQALVACGGGQESSTGSGSNGAPATGGGTAGNGTVAPATGGTPASTATTVPNTAGMPLGLYQSYKTGTTPVTNTLCDPTGCYSYGSSISSFKHINLVFNANGYVHEGEANSSDALNCRTPASTPKCLAYSIQGDHITLGGKNLTFSANAQAGTMKLGGYDHDFEFIAPAQRGKTLNGYFNNTDCYLGTCTRSGFTFKTDGTVSYAGSSLSASAGWGVGVWSSGGNGFNGRYEIDGYTITLISASGERAPAFLAIDADGKGFQFGTLLYSLPTN
jgi:hypothetical protein